MGLKILCSGFLFRHPLGGHTWHHLQYLIGLQQLGHDVSYFEHFGWPDSCYDVSRDEMTADPSYGIAYMTKVFERHRVPARWCYLAEDGAAHGMPREELATLCRECDVYLNLSNLNWIDELQMCRRRVLVDTDPVFTQIGALGMGGLFSNYHALFTYGENVHRTYCTMPTGGAKWLPTRQPVVLDLWKATESVGGSFSTVMNWTPMPEQEYQGRIFAQKDREFEPFFTMPHTANVPMEIALNGPNDVKKRLRDGGWKMSDPLEISRDPWTYQRYLQSSLAEFCVAKHGYVTTHCGWFSDRTTAYLASGRPAVVQDTGFSDFFPCDEGLICWKDSAEALAGIRSVISDVKKHSLAARRIVEEFFDAKVVLSDLLTRCV